ncbi:hypothetical protein [Thalassospira alkalitolerans]|uniref:hypothetical protein n=1 Tax=Thalassospira alkalitolerans TaxID=1293890 RepID=UPI003AA8F4BD
MTDIIETYLEDFGPALSGTISEHLEKSLGISAAAARKRVSRASGNIRRLGYVTFARKARFMYLENQFGSPLYWRKLVDALFSTNSAYGYAIAALIQRGGFVPEWEFPIVCGAPIKQSRHLSPATIMQRLKEAGLLQTIQVNGLGDCICIVQSEEHYNSLAADTRVRLITENILLLAVKDWLRKLGIVSFDKVTIRSSTHAPKVGTFVWDLTAPSYLGCLIKTGKDKKVKPGFVAADVYLGDTITEPGSRPFINKCKTLRALRNVGPCMQIFIANRYEKEAFSLLKQNGIMPATPESLFGEDVAKGLSELTSVLHDAASHSLDPERFERLFAALGKIEGAANQLRGTLFEYIAAEVARKNYSSLVRMNQIYKNQSGKKAEADVVTITDNISVRFIECKGYSPRGIIPDTEVRRWLQHNVPVIYKAVKVHPDWQNLDIKFEFWTTGILSDEAIAMIKTAQVSTKATRYSLGFKLNQDVYDLCKSTKDKGLITAFEKHYLPPY